MHIPRQSLWWSIQPGLEWSHFSPGKPSFFPIEHSLSLSPTGNWESHFFSSYQETLNTFSFYWNILDFRITTQGRKERRREHCEKLCPEGSLALPRRGLLALVSPNPSLDLAIQTKSRNQPGFFFFYSLGCDPGANPEINSAWCFVPHPSPTPWLLWTEIPKSKRRFWTQSCRCHVVRCPVSTGISLSLWFIGCQIHLVVGNDTFKIMTKNTM